MRIGACLVAFLMSCDHYDASDIVCGDGRPDIGEQCEPDDPGCGPDCKWEKRTHVFRWSFVNATTGMASTCLPGSPEVTIKMGGPEVVEDCALGEARLVVPAYVYSVSIQSGGLESPRSTFDLDLVEVPTSVVSWDGGYARVHWTVQDAQANSIPCGGSMTVGTVLLYLDGARAWQSTVDCAAMEALVGPIGPDVHTIRADAYGYLNGTYGLVRSTAPVDISAEPGTVVDGPTITITMP